MNPFNGNLELPITQLKLSLGTQWLTTFLAVAVKPAYMILSLLIIIWLWRTSEPSLRLIRWALILFLGGEMFCALNYLLANSQSDLLEILHSLGMVGMSMFLPWGFLLLIDDRLIHFSVKNSKCEWIKFCGSCWKFTEATCKFKQLSWFVIPAIAAVALLPLPAPISSSHMAINAMAGISNFPFVGLSFYTGQFVFYDWKHGRPKESTGLLLPGVWLYDVFLATVFPQQRFCWFAPMV
jgi:hypothetical protein